MRERRVLFWDFDGVIKESVEVKTRAYLGLFERFGPILTARIREHHEAHGGMSRFEKIPLYLSWADCSTAADEVRRCCDAFALAVRQRVIEAEWVPGAREYLQANHVRQCCVVLTATPQSEIEEILKELAIAAWFREVHGAPTSKAGAIAAVLQRWSCPPTDALLIGDSASDYEAAKSAHIDFLLRRTPSNVRLQHGYQGPQCENFLNG